MKVRLFFLSSEQHPGFKRLLEQEGIDKAWRNELMLRVNELAGITGITINPGDDGEYR